VASLSGSLGILAFFKYADFMVGSAGDLINVMGGHAVEWHLDIVLPVGISFYTFQTMGYTIDVYRGKLSASDRIVPFALFVAYFPQLVAGPIERATHLLPILSRARSVSWSQSVEGVYLIVFGLFKKVAIANGVAPAVNSVYSGSSNSSAIDIAMATVLFAIQILCDFSGYSDIARGTSRILGIELMRNFRVPYMARNPGDFWRRWHISLSSWFRDYLYIPLGGNRGGALSTYRNLAITMVLAGLWHGAAWNFLLWGAFHGALLCLHRLMFGSSNETSSGLLSHGLAAIGFFFLACYGWLLFRAESLSQIVEFTTALATGAGSLSHQISMPKLAAVLGIPLLVAVEVMDYRQGIRSVYLRASPMQRGLFLATTLFVLLVGTGNAPQQFIYFQF
jgi:D-alanyl-lipoteichoic acid acyltransferase DltB (MBOAT superfamily)